ncbi:hypothetical protein UPYG_G00193420 [Umbra pygmaea]|uniref:Trehalase n=1 Tax=Umbra pygmaea TaxID=75934 RepID=A0ABD0X2S4_UMBPY
MRDRLQGMFFILWSILVALLCPLSWCNSALLPPCDSEIFCHGEILRRMQTAKLFDDDKHFVDMKLKSDPDIILSAFNNLTHESSNTTLLPSTLRKFLSMYFEEPGTELEPWSPPDWHDTPQFLARISDTELRSWAKKLHHLWKTLGRKIREDVSVHPERHSLIFTPHPVIVPGGRFRELYYWDSYWVINGLLLSEMTDTARGMINNFLYLVQKYGFIPNGSRVYYERRSQPPFLTLMVESYYQATKDETFLRSALPILEQEYMFWMKNRSVDIEVNGMKHVLNRYNVHVGLPRPESYTDDVELAEGLTEDGAETLWKELNTGAESGWDFSSRWFVDGKSGSNRTLKDIRTSSLLPTDLNALLCRNERTLAQFYRTVGEEVTAARFDKAVSARLEAIEAVLWNEEHGVWLDYSLLTNTSRPDFYPSNLAPLWAACYSQAAMGQRALHYLEASGGVIFPNGVPTSLVDSGEQWDYPNAWPPLQHMLIQGLSSLPSEKAQELGFDLAQNWVRTNWLAYMKYDAMFEKYNVNGDGKPGGGGEYEVQLGFGWTNGVALQLLNQYGERLTSSCSTQAGNHLGVMVAVLGSALSLLL